MQSEEINTDVSIAFTEQTGVNASESSNDTAINQNNDVNAENINDASDKHGSDQIADKSRDIPVKQNTDASPEYIITADQLVKSYHLGDGSDLTVLDHMDLRLPKGEVIMIMGRSGSGKTTLINVLSTLDDFNEGSIRLLDREYSTMNDTDKEKLRRYQMGFVFQSVALIPAMTAYENIDFGLRTAGIKKGRHERIMEVLEIVGLSDRGNHYPVQLSGGERQRIAIARAMAHRPPVIFADEPTGALDTESGHHIADLFCDLAHKEGISIIMTTHDIRLSEKADVLIRL